MQAKMVLALQKSLRLLRILSMMTKVYWRFSSFPNPPDPNAGYEAFVRASAPPHDYRNPSAQLYAKISTSGDLEVYGTVDEDYQASAIFVTTWDPSLYFLSRLMKSWTKFPDLGI